jgi:hypothetical protein
LSSLKRQSHPPFAVRSRIIRLRPTCSRSDRE